MTNARGGRARGEAEKGFHFCKPGKINEICKGSLISLYNVKKKCSFNRYHLIPLLRQSIADRSQEAPWVLQQRQKDQEYNEEAESSSSPSSSQRPCFPGGMSYEKGRTSPKHTMQARVCMLSGRKATDPLKRRRGLVSKKQHACVLRGTVHDSTDSPSSQPPAPCPQSLELCVLALPSRNQSSEKEN